MKPNESILKQSNFKHWSQFHPYTNELIDCVKPFALSTFSPSHHILNLVKEYENKYQIDYDNTEKAYRNQVTIYNFNKIKEILDEKKIKLVIMQYPLMDAKPLEGMFSSKENIIFVDNEKFFTNPTA